MTTKPNSLIPEHKALAVQAPEATPPSLVCLTRLRSFQGMSLGTSMEDAGTAYQKDCLCNFLDPVQNEKVKPPVQNVFKNLRMVTAEH